MGSVGHAPDIAKNAVLVKSVEPEERVICRGYDKWEERHDGNIDYNAMFESLQYTGFQATSFGLAVNEIRRMVSASYARIEACQACLRTRTWYAFIYSFFS